MRNPDRNEANAVSLAILNEDLFPQAFEREQSLRREDILEGISHLLQRYGITQGHQWEILARLGTLHTVKGLEYAASGVSLLPPDIVRANRSHLTDALAAFEIWRHGANIFDDFTDEELHRTEYRTLMELPLNNTDLLIVQNTFHFIGITEMIRFQQEHDARNDVTAHYVPEVARLFGNIYVGWQQKTSAMKRRVVWDETGDPLQSYWEHHVPVSTAWFYQIPFTLIGLAAENPRLQQDISDLGYCLGELIHSKNDLQDLPGDIESGDFSYPVTSGLLAGVLLPSELSDATYASEEKMAFVRRLAAAGIITRFVQLIEERINGIRAKIEGVRQHGGTCGQFIRVVQYLDRRIHEVEQDYLDEL